MNKKKLIQEIEKALGYDKIEPIRVSPNMQKEFEEEGDFFRALYEEELLARYKEIESKE